MGFCVEHKKLEELIQDTANKNIQNLEFKNWKFEKIDKLTLTNKSDNSRLLYKLSLIKWEISKDSVIRIVNSIRNISQIDISENSFTQKEAQSICDELSYLDFIYMFKNKHDLSGVNSNNLIL